MNRKLFALVVLLAFGLLKLPLERACQQSLRGSGLLSPPVSLGLRENLGQMGFAASLGGLRSLVASVTYLQAFTAFENVDWAKVDGLFQLTTRLQPGYDKYWEEASWHMAYNAATSYLYNRKNPPAIRRQLARDHIQRGISILNEGLRYLPKSGLLWTKLGDIYARRGINPLTDDFHALDVKQAGECYLRGFENGALPVYERLGAYQLALTDDPPSLRRAHEILTRHYQHGVKTPGLIHSLKLVERKLAIPAEQRIPDPEPQLRK